MGRFARRALVRLLERLQGVGVTQPRRIAVRPRNLRRGIDPNEHHARATPTVVKVGHVTWNVTSVVEPAPTTAIVEAVPATPRRPFANRTDRNVSLAKATLIAKRAKPVTLDAMFV